MKYALELLINFTIIINHGWLSCTISSNKKFLSENDNGLNWTPHKQFFSFVLLEDLVEISQILFWLRFNS